MKSLINNKIYKNNYLAPKRIDLFNEISKEIDGAFNEIFGSNFFNGLNKHKGYPLMDAIRTGNKLIFQYGVPGVNKQDIKAEITEDDELGKLLTISGQLNNNYVHNENDYQIRELSKHEFKRIVKLPEDVTDDEPESILENGILTLSFNLKTIENIKPKIKQLNIN